MAKKEPKHHLHIELTQQQYQLLCRQAKQSGLTKRAYLARLIEGQPVKARPSQEIKELRTEIHHIGNNINQIARSVNAGIAKPEDAKRGLYLLDRVYELMYQVAKK
ncbi:plasmid mobilization protein [Dysosmobacter welbionis]|uniref:plasmid mobilization protein n=1 Tax=Dysosmobacter welbionis TaxID=2093857 RepID=UPI0010AE20BF|nr:plasmid mobilization relaxosome protein MobC [Dysosmobacter welbionis]